MRHMTAHAVPFTLPSEVINEIDAAVESAPTAASAVRALAALVGLLEVPVDQVRHAAEKQLGETLFLTLMPSVHYRDGKVAFRATGQDEKRREAVARNVDAHLAVVESLLARQLTRLASRITDATLFETVASWPHLEQRRTAWLQRASERFHAGDFMTSGMIVALLYEALVRDLVRASGVSALKTDSDGLLSDETLGSLLQQTPLRAALGEDHVWFVEYVLCRPELGPNLRNEVAHGNAAAWDLTAPRVFLIWLFVVRLTFYGPSAPAADGGDASSSPAPPSSEEAER
jgi:hypothetical protein